MDQDKLQELAQKIVDALHDYADTVKPLECYGLPVHSHGEELRNIVMGHIAQAFDIDLQPK